jgi:hypothetical protein
MELFNGLSTLPNWVRSSPLQNYAASYLLWGNDEFLKSPRQLVVKRNLVTQNDQNVVFTPTSAPNCECSKSRALG